MPSIIPGYLGIDPGKKGGMVFIQGSEVDIFSVERKRPRDIYHWIAEKAEKGVSYVAIEEVRGYMGGKSPDLGSDMFEFGRSMGWYDLALDLLYIEPMYVVPKKWQSEFGLVKTKGESNTEWKSKIKRVGNYILSSQEFSWGEGVKLTLATADAFLIAMYCKRIKERQ